MIIASKYLINEPNYSIDVEYNYDDDTVSATFASEYHQNPMTLFITREQAFELLDKLGVAITDDYKSLSDYISLQLDKFAQENINQLKCPYCNTWGNASEFEKDY